MTLTTRVEALERSLPPAPEDMPDHITIVRGRRDNPRLPDGYFPCDITIVRLDPDGNRVETHIQAPEAL